MNLQIHCNMQAYKLLILSVLAALSFSCTRVQEEGVVLSGLTELTLHYPEVEVLDDTKMEIGSVKYEVLWKTGDAVAVYDRTAQKLHKYVLLSSSNNTQDGRFQLASGESQPAAGHDLYVLYPYHAYSISGSTLYVEIYADRDGGYVYSNEKAGNAPFKLNDILMTNKFVVGGTLSSTTVLPSSSSDLTAKVSFMNRKVALLELNLTMSLEALMGEKITSVVFKAPGIAGKVPVTFSSTGSPSIAANSGNRDRFTVITSARPPFAYSGHVVKFVPIFPVNVANGLTFLFENDKYEVGFHRQQSASFGANANTYLNLFEGLYPNQFANEEAAGTTNFSWWCTPQSDVDLEGDAHAGAYKDVPIPVSTPGEYTNGDPLEDPS